MNGGDDGTRTRGLCRDRETTRRKYLKVNGVGRHSWAGKEFSVTGIVLLTYPDFLTTLPLTVGLGEGRTRVCNDVVGAQWLFWSAFGDKRFKKRFQVSSRETVPFGKETSERKPLVPRARAPYLENRMGKGLNRLFARPCALPLRHQQLHTKPVGRLAGT